MEIPTYLLFVLGCLGAADIAAYHSFAHGIRSHRDSAKELIAHSLRGPTYAALFVLIPNFALQGLFAWALLAVLLLDLSISIWDFWLEQDSRRFLGGLPSGEYVLHMIMAMVFGAFVTTLVSRTSPWFTAPTRLVYAPAAVPVLVRVMMTAMALLVLWSGCRDAIAASRLRNAALRAEGERTFGWPPHHKSFHIATPGGDLMKPKLVRRWMPAALTAAGIYNLAWGAWVILNPLAFFRWTGSAPINYPQVWQCVGMIVGVYGIGYLIAARDPLRHWPIVLVGLLGKVFGPMGMCWSIFSGSLPSSMAWVCLTNDLIWWLPFALILARAWAERYPASSWMKVCPR